MGGKCWRVSRPLYDKNAEIPAKPEIHMPYNFFDTSKIYKKSS